MGIVLDIMGRNLRLFFRDRLSVFFSLLGALIVFLLYTLFLSNLQTTSIAEPSRRPTRRTCAASSTPGCSRASSR